MTILHLETSTKNCSVSISKNGQLLSLCEEHDQGFGQAEKVHRFVEWALEGAEIQLKDLDAVCVSKGPGSFTGLRIGVSAAKGFCYGLNIPLIALDSLEILAYSQIGKETEVIIPMIDARRMDVYTAVFDGYGKRLTPIKAITLDEDSFQEYADKKIILIGDAVEKGKEVLQIQNADFKLGIYPSAEYMVELAERKYQNKNFENVAYFEPFYLKEFMAGRKSKKNLN